MFSPKWSNENAAHAGAITWGDGAAGTAGAVSASNSLVGGSTGDFDWALITVLANGNWVVGNSNWSNGASAHVGASTWIDGHAPLVGPISAQNSLTGSTPDDDVGTGVYALTNGNYVVTSPFWQNQGIPNAGAASWADGSAMRTGEVSAENSLVGSHTFDFVGRYDFFAGSGVVALTNGNYIVLSPTWNGNGVAQIGAATWGNGSTGISGEISPTNSLFGDSPLDGVGDYALALANGNAVIGSLNWHGVGAVTWMSGATGLVGPVSIANSLTSTSPGIVGANVIADGNNYFSAEPDWSFNGVEWAGAVTWGDGNHGITGAVTSDNSLVGQDNDEQIGATITLVGNGNVVITGGGNVTLARGSSAIMGVQTADNSVMTSSGNVSAFDYDVARDRLIVGSARGDAIYVFQADLLLRNGFD